MSDKPTGESSGGFSIGDIYFVLFRHKWKILILSLLGFMAAGAVMVIKPAPYQSVAKIQITSESERTPGPPGTDGGSRAIDFTPEMVISREMDSFQSHDLGLMVATNLGPERLLRKPGTGGDYEEASAVVLKNLLVEQSTKGSSVVKVIFQHPDKELAKQGLDEILTAYFKRQTDKYHLPVADSVFVNETNRLRHQIAETQRELASVKTKAGVSSLADDKRTLIEQKSETVRQLRETGAELAQHEAMATKSARPEMTGTNVPANTNKPVEISAITQEIQDDYDLLRKALKELKDAEYNYVVRLKYQPQNPQVVDVRNQIARTKGELEKMEQEHPALAATIAPSPVSVAQPGAVLADPAAEASLVLGLKAKRDVLAQELAQINASQRKIDEMEPAIRELEQKLKRQEDDLTYYLAKLEQADLDRSAGVGGNQQGIKYISSPTPAVKQWSKPFQKKLAMVAFSGVFAGLGLAFLIEFVLDRSVKRPIEIETKLKLPLFISIPDINHNGHRRLAQAAATNRKLLRNSTEEGVTIASPESANGAGQVEVAPWDRRHALHRFYEGLRDRLIVYFEVRNLVHKPKLVAVTSCNKGAGVSSIAAGLAASLSQTGDGNVLLVDMNEEQGSAQQFYKGRPGCGLDAALETGTMQSALIEGNLYVATERLNNKVKRVLPGGLATMLPKLKASDYDYIIFDMPPVSQTSMTPRLAGLMDMVLLVIESEKTNQDVVKRATALLGESKAIVSTVLNKTRNYVPAQLHQDSLEDS